MPAGYNDTRRLKRPGPVLYKTVLCKTVLYKAGTSCSSASTRKRFRRKTSNLSQAADPGLPGTNEYDDTTIAQ